MMDNIEYIVRLWLVKVIEGTCDSNAPEIDVSSLFGKKLPVEAKWYSGVLRIPKGKLLDYVHMGYESVYEEELLLTISSGRLVKAEVKNNRPSK